MIDLVREVVAKIILESGADYVGRLDRLIMFQSRQTGSTLAMPVNEILMGGKQAVQAHINESNTRFADGTKVL